ncbi:MAG: UvrD-helicase domain-containing protein [Alphaproteobacteria bacterium]|nr:UvrD-helicase domain-containing protein [Alphaproteobacteria bacterium]
MPSSEIIIAAAGGGKTTTIVDSALAAAERCALVTYTINNTDEISRRFYDRARAIPPGVSVMTWYTFLLRDCVRPYMSAILTQPVAGFHFTNAKSAIGIARAKADIFFCDKRGYVYSDKVSQLACECDDAMKGAVMKRLAERFGRIYIDEVQDLAGWDLELVEKILRAGINVTLIGDHRQATYRTNPSPKNRQFQDYKIIDKFKLWNKKNLATLKFLTETHRCNQEIADFADRFFPKDEATVSRNKVVTGHDGVFLVGAKEVEAYRERFQPQVLRLSRQTKECDSMNPMNFGESKGLTFDRVLIFPHKAGKDWLGTGDYSKIEKVASKLYVAATRARYSVGFVCDKVSPIPGVTRWAQ